MERTPGTNGGGEEEKVEREREREREIASAGESQMKEGRVGEAQTGRKKKSSGSL